MQQTTPAINENSFSWSLLIPSHPVEEMHNIYNTFATHGLDFKNERVKNAAYRALCLSGMAFGSLMVTSIVWDVFWSSTKVILQIGLYTGVFLTCRILFGQFQDQQNNKLPNLP